MASLAQAVRCFPHAKLGACWAAMPRSTQVRQPSRMSPRNKNCHCLARHCHTAMCGEMKAFVELLPMQRAHAGFAFDLSGRVRDSGWSVVVEMCDLRRKMAMTDLAMAL